MTPLPPDREAVILREMRDTFCNRDATNEFIYRNYDRHIALCDRIWSHVESLHAAALVEARREALTLSVGTVLEYSGVMTVQEIARRLVGVRDSRYPLPRPAIAPVPLSGGRTLAWDGGTREYVVADQIADAYRYSNTDRLMSAFAFCLADARAILAFVAQVEGVAT